MFWHLNKTARLVLICLIIVKAKKASLALCSMYDSSEISVFSRWVYLSTGYDAYRKNQPK